MEEAEKARLEGLLNEAMVGIYLKAQAECGYNAAPFHARLNTQGALGTARYILQPGNPPGDVIEFYGLGRPDLLVEVFALRKDFQPLFTDREREEAVRRLKLLGYIR
ncbi:MAG: hypothetical protein FJ315_00465 [SAR202 cluster bacterium]|nr:hypothetical protein [SAR202 cluster bacterium]